MKKIIALITVIATSQASAWWDSDNGQYNTDGRFDGRGYGYGDGYGRGDASGSGDMDSEFTMTFRGRGRSDANMRGDYSGNYYGRGYGYGDGRGYGYNYSQPYYGYPPRYNMPPAVPVKPQGPADDDRDGVANISDLCPDTAANTPVDALGCDADSRIVLRGVNFKTNSDELTEESLAILNVVSKTLSANPQLKVVVEGHTDADGDAVYNKDLSQRRAQSVVNYLVAKSVNPNNLIAKGYGEEQPVASNDSAEGKAQNRRVELNRL